MEGLCKTILEDIQQPKTDDPITACGQNVLKLLLLRPAELIHLAHDKLHAYPFTEVPTCWRRLYTDGSIAKAVLDIQANARNSTNDWQGDIVKTLDMALIMTGAPLRCEMIEQLVSAIQESCIVRPNKRQKLDDLDTREGLELPELRFPVPHASLSMAAFQAHLAKPTPLILTGVIGHWPALEGRPWKSPSYLLEKTFGGRRLVPVELGRTYTDEGWGQAIITFGEFMDKYLISNKGTVGYLAQHDLFSQIPSLRNDISIPDYCYTSPPPPPSGTPLADKKIPELEEPLINAWFGPA